MKTLVVYDSTYSNTEKIAKAIGSGIKGDVKVLRTAEANPADFASFNLIVIGSPTYGGRPMPSVADLMNKISESAVKGKNVAAFDTRIPTKIVKYSALPPIESPKTSKTKVPTSLCRLKVSLLTAKKARSKTANWSVPRPGPKR